MVDQILVTQRQPEHPLAASVLTSCSTKPAEGESRKHAANRSTSRIARSVAPSNKSPASVVIVPPSKDATTAQVRIPTDPGYILVGIGTLR